MKEPGRVPGGKNYKSVQSFLRLDTPEIVMSEIYLYWAFSNSVTVSVSLPQYKFPQKILLLSFWSNKLWSSVYVFLISGVEVFPVTSILCWRRWWHPTPVLLPGKSHGRRSLVGCSPWGGEESNKTSLSLFTFMHWRRKWQPTPVFLPGESQGWGSLVGCRLWGHTELDTTEVT